MAVLDIITWPDKRLKEVSQPVAKIDKNLQIFMDDMLETMHQANGIGLAAVQVAVLKRILLMEIEPNDRYPNLKGNTGPCYFINPEIVEKSDEMIDFEEGCLSFPGVYANVKRHKEIKVKYLDYDGKEQHQEMSDITSICFQHELDHLNGVTFVDKLSRMKKEMILKKYQKNNK